MHVKGPKSLYFRFLLITIVPVIIIQMITTYIFYERHWDSLSRNMVGSLTGEISLVINGLKATPVAEREKFLVIATSNMDLSVLVKANTQPVPKGNLNKRYPDLISNINMKADTNIYLFNIGHGKMRIDAPLGEDMVSVIFSDKRLINPSTYIFILWVVGSALIFMTISVLFLRIQVRSILNLTKAAEGFGKGDDLKYFKPSGAREVRRAGIAFIEMKERIRRLIDTRTQMLAGVSHDLKTPLTRMKLILSLIKDKESKQNIESEVDEMNKMIDGYLNFARLDSPDQFVEPVTSLNLKEFIETMVGRYQNFPNKISVNIPDYIFINVRPEYFSRSIANIIDNSIKYAKKLEITAHVDDENCYMIFDDDGPGIPDDKLDEVFQPFYRIDQSRNTETGGVGLGLSITRDIINKHGGDIKLSRSGLGGLRSIIILPK